MPVNGTEHRTVRWAPFFLVLIQVAGSVAGCTPEPAEPRPAEEYPSLATDGAWCWFGDPRAIRHQGVHDKIYAGWVDQEGSIVVSSLDMETGERIEHTVQLAFNRDDHANPSLLTQPDGTVIVFYTSHGSDVSESMYYRVSQHPEDITSWSEVREIGTNTEGPRGHTYPNPVRLGGEGGRTYLFWRGGNFKPAFSFTDDMVTWAPARTTMEPRRIRWAA